jgi:uncharacterized membrane protein YgaE (UPF0421/DUF939 family)
MDLPPSSQATKQQSFGVVMVITRLYPLDRFRQAFGILVGTVIAALFAVYIFVNLGSF